MPSVKRFLCLVTAFAKPITAARREGNTLSPLLRNAWDAQTMEGLTRSKGGKSKDGAAPHGPLRATNHQISVNAHITPDEHAKLLGGSVEIANGFSNRFSWSAVRSTSLPTLRLSADGRSVFPIQ
jgi:hypothetical protein